jgi:hypothetical protein
MYRLQKKFKLIESKYLWMVNLVADSLLVENKYQLNPHQLEKCSLMINSMLDMFRILDYFKLLYLL